MNSAINPDAPVYVAGHTGLVGSALRRALLAHGHANFVLRTHAELDLTDAAAVKSFFQQERPEYVFLAAARVGGIMANHTYRADFIRENLAIEINVLHQAYLAGVRRLLFLGSSCIYPKLAPQPIKEEYLLTGPLEPTNRAYALAKIAGIEMCWSYNRQYNTRFLAVMPTNLYGPGDNYDLNTSHVIPALISKFVEAKERNQPAVFLWGTGTPRREFLHSQEMAEACLFLMKLADEEFQVLISDAERPPIINIGTGEDVTILELAELIAELVGFKGEIRFDSSKPDGTPRKLLDVSRLRDVGWNSRLSLREGLRCTIEDYIEHHSTQRSVKGHC